MVKRPVKPKILPGTERGTIRRMVEGHRRVVLTAMGHDHWPVPLHHFVVPLPCREDPVT